MTHTLRYKEKLTLEKIRNNIILKGTMMMMMMMIIYKRRRHKKNCNISGASSFL